jgi:hypothetical protein
VTLRVTLTLAVACLLLAGSCALVAADDPAVTAPDEFSVASADDPAVTAPEGVVATDGPAGDDALSVQSPAAPLAADSGPPAPVAELRQSTSVAGVQGPPDTDATVTRIRVLPNGTAVWSLTIRMELDSDEAEADFAAFQAEFEANRSEFVDSYRTPTTSAVAEAENDTGREMTATGYEAGIGTEAVPREWGFVTYEFRWTGFAPVENGTVPVGDAFEGGLFLEENGILKIQSPEGYEPTAVEPTPDQQNGGELRWEGPVSFSDRRPSVVFVPEGESDDSTDGSTDDSADDTADDSTDGSTDDSTDGSTDDSADGTTDDSSDGTTDDSTDDGSSGGGLSSGPVMFGTAGIAVLVGIGAFYLHRRRQHPDREASSDGAAAVAADDGPTPDDAGGAADESDEMPDLATDEDRVLAALEAADGRMRQSELADELDWSPSKTSRVLSDMSDEGNVEKLRIGRENVIDLADDGEE